MQPRLHAVDGENLPLIRAGHWVVMLCVEITLASIHRTMSSMYRGAIHCMASIEQPQTITAVHGAHCFNQLCTDKNYSIDHSILGSVESNHAVARSLQHAEPTRYHDKGPNPGRTRTFEIQLCTREVWATARVFQLLKPYLP